MAYKGLEVAMRQLHSGWFGLVLALTITSWAVVVQAEEFRYHYVSLTEALPGFFFAPTAINDSGRVYGIAYDAASGDPHVAVYADGVVTVLQPGNAWVANARGTIGEFVTDPQTGTSQAALFRGTKAEIIPFLPGETRTFVQSLNDSDTTLVWSEDPSGLNRNTYRLYSNGKFTFRFQIPNGSDCSPCWEVNNHEIVAGTIYDGSLNAFRAIRFQPPYGETLSLDPLPADIDSDSTDVNILDTSLACRTSSSMFFPITAMGSGTGREISRLTLRAYITPRSLTTRSLLS